MQPSTFMCQEMVLQRPHKTGQEAPLTRASPGLRAPQQGKFCGLEARAAPEAVGPSERLQQPSRHGHGGRGHQGSGKASSCRRGWRGRARGGAGQHVRQQQHQQTAPCPALPLPRAPLAPPRPLRRPLEDAGAEAGPGGRRDRCVGAAGAHMAGAQGNMAVALFARPPHPATHFPPHTHLPLLQVAGLLLDEVHDFVEGIKGVL